MARICLLQEEVVFNEGEDNEFTIDVKTVTTERLGATSVRGGILLSDLDKRQQLREHTVHPPGQECYLRPIDQAAIKAKIAGHTDAGGTAATDVTDAKIQALVDNTAKAGDLKRDTIETEIGTAGTLTLDPVDGGSEEQQADYDLITDVQNLLALKLVETGNFLLSFDGGVISKLLQTTDGAGNPVVKVLKDDGSADFTL